MSHNKDKDNKAVYDNKIVIKNYSLGSFFDKNFGFTKPRVISI